MAKKKKAPPAEKENGERWLVSYSDFVTLLLGVFIIMYSMAAADAAKAGGAEEAQAAFIEALAGAFGNSILSEMDNGDSILETYAGESLAEQEAKDMEEIKEEIEQMAEELAEQNLEFPEDSIEVTIDELGVHIRIKDTVLFASGSPDINKNAVPILIKIGNALKRFHSNYIHIEGHTDNVPMGGNIKYLETNWELGSLRAVRVLKTLVEECALNPTKLSATSYGEFRPLVNVDTADARSKNRRVEITILRNYNTMIVDM